MNRTRSSWIPLILNASALSPMLALGDESNAAQLAATEYSEGPEVPSAVRQHRPQRTADCPYTFDEFLRRITALALDKDLYTVETLETLIGVPQPQFRNLPRSHRMHRETGHSGFEGPAA